MCFLGGSDTFIYRVAGNIHHTFHMRLVMEPYSKIRGPNCPQIVPNLDMRVPEVS